MSLPATQQRILVKIEGGLTASDPVLSSRFVMFSRLTNGEAMPGVEQIRPRPIADRLLPVVTAARRVSRRPAARVRALMLLPAALTAMLCALAISVGFPGAHRGTPAAKSPAARELVVGKGKVCRLGIIRGATVPCPH
jgi:hypothetical protein